MAYRDPPEVAVLSAQIARAYPSISPYSAAHLAAEFASIERAQRRHAERCCSGADGGYTKRVNEVLAGVATGRTVVVHDPDAEVRAERRILARLTEWRGELGRRAFPDGVGKPDGHPSHEAMIAASANARVTTHDDPRGDVLLVQFLPCEGGAS